MNYLYADVLVGFNYIEKLDFVVLHSVSCDNRQGGNKLEDI